MGSTYDFGTLKKSLAPEAGLLLPDDPGYEESIERWSETCKKRAVRWVSMRLGHISYQSAFTTHLHQGVLLVHLVISLHLI